MPKVSVVIPCYNCECIVGDAIDSVESQTCDDWEIIVVDDGSSDNTVDYIKAFYKNARVREQANAGPAAARNTGIREAEGEYIAFLDSDDIWLPKKLARQVNVLDDDPNVGLVFCDGYLWHPTKSTSCSPVMAESYVRPPIRPSLDLMFKINMIPTSSAMFRRKLVETVGFMDEQLRIGEDFEFFLRLAAKQDTFYMPDPLMAYRIHSGNTSSLVTSENVGSRLHGKIRARLKALEANPELKHYLTIRLFGLLPSCLKYVMLLFWRFRYGASSGFISQALLRYGQRLLESLG